MPRKLTTKAITDDAITADKIVAGAVVADIGAGTVTPTHLHSTLDLSGKTITLPSLTNIGIGTASPAKKLHIKDAAPDIRLEDTDSNGVAEIRGNTGTGSLVIATDVNNAIADSKITFQVDNDEKARIDDGGALLINKTSSDVGTAGHELLDYGRAIHTANATTVQVLNRLGNDGDITIFQRDGTTVGSISQASSSTTYNTTSDERLKENIKPISDGVEKLMAMNPVNFTWKKYPDDPSQHGFIAQEMEKILPEAVTSSEYMSMDYGRITPILVAALQDALKRIQELEEKINVSK